MDLCITCGNKAVRNEVYCSECLSEFLMDFDEQFLESDEGIPTTPDKQWFEQQLEKLEDLFKSDILDKVSTTIDSTIPF